MKSLKIKSAWLVTWDGTKLPHERVITVLNYRMGAEKVREIIEQIYLILANYTVREKLMYACTAQENPYRAQVHKFERVTCGHNPWLYARRVSNLSMKGDDLIWTEPPSEAELHLKLKEMSLLK